MRVSSAALLLAIVAVSSCSSGRHQDRRISIVAAPIGNLLLPTITPAPDLLVAADPKLDGFASWPLRFRVTHGSYAGLTCRINLTQSGAPVASLTGMMIDHDHCTASWDGHLTGGPAVGPGVVDVAATLSGSDGTELAQTSTQIEVVRLGFAEIALSGAAGSQAALLYPRTGGVRAAFYELAVGDPQWRIGPDRSETGASTLDLASGMPRALPPPWDDVGSPPTDSASTDRIEHDTFNLPAAFVAGTQVQIALTAAADVPAPTIADLRVVAPDGAMISGGDGAFVPGTTVSAVTTTSPVPAVGRYDVAFAWRFQALSPTGDWVDVPGEIDTTHRLYGLVGQPLFRYTSLPHRTWVDVLDQVAAWVDGASADPVEVAGSIVEGVYNDMDLQYDRASGASAYTDYPAGWDGAVFDLSAFQLRTLGRTINCSDAGSIVSTYADMVGIDFGYHILTHRFDSGFDLNYIKAIGWPDFDETPFFGDRGSFRYHAVVGPPDGTIYDATLALDGDGTPTAAPFSDLMAEGMAPIDYLTDLTSTPTQIDIELDDKVRIR